MWQLGDTESMTFGGQYEGYGGVMGALLAIAINGTFWVLVAEGIYALWINQARSASDKARRTRSKKKNWDGRWRWVLIAFVVVAAFSQYGYL
jgi:hypothetical protein